MFIFFNDNRLTMIKLNHTYFPPFSEENLSSSTMYAMLASSPSTANSKLLTPNWFYTFSAKERDTETGLSYFGSRYYSSDLSIWLSVDPMSDKYASLSPYNYCVNNPIKLVDPNGEEWVVAADEATHNDVLSIVNPQNRERVIFNSDGTVSVNLEGLSEEQLQKDIGLNLINDLVQSDYRYYFEVSDVAFCCTRDMEKTVGVISNTQHKGVLNASRFGKDYRNDHTYLPMNGFDGQVVITISGKFSLNGTDVRKNIVFHELKENYLRTDLKMDYWGPNGVGAHRTASRIESNAWGTPGGQANYEAPSPKCVIRKPDEDVLNYINYGTYR